MLKDILNQGEKEFDRIFPCIQTGCDNNGSIAERVGEDEWEQQQCQYCDERRLPLKKLFISQQHKLLQSIVEEIKNHKFNIFSAKTVLQEGNVVLSQVSETNDLIKVSELRDLLDSLKTKLLDLDNRK